MNTSRNPHAKTFHRDRAELAEAVKRSLPNYLNSAVTRDRLPRPSRDLRKSRRAETPEQFSKCAGDPTERRRDVSGGAYDTSRQKQNMNATFSGQLAALVQEPPADLDPLTIIKVHEELVRATDRGADQFSDLPEEFQEQLRQWPRYSAIFVLV